MKDNIKNNQAGKGPQKHLHVSNENYRNRFDAIKNLGKKPKKIRNPRPQI